MINCDWQLIDDTYPDDAPAQRALHDALRDDHSDDADFAPAPPPGWGEPDAPPPTVDDLEGDPLPGRWGFVGVDIKTLATNDAQSCLERKDYKNEGINYAISRSG